MSVSIVIPCYNTGQYVGEAISSALSQTHKPVEVIVVDDGSVDDTAQVLADFGDVTLVTQPNQGVATARNTGLALATGDYVVFLDADDRLADHAVERGVDAFQQHGDVGMVFGGNRLIDQHGDVIGVNVQPARLYGFEDVLLGTVPSPSQSMFRRDVVMSVGGFNPDVQPGEDFDLYLRVTRHGGGYCHGTVVADYRQHPGQATKHPSILLRNMLGVVRSHMDDPADGHVDDAVWKEALRHWQVYFGQFIPSEILRSVVGREWRRAGVATRLYLRHFRHAVRGTLKYAPRRLSVALRRSSRSSW